MIRLTELDALAVLKAALTAEQQLWFSGCDGDAVLGRVARLLADVHKRAGKEAAVEIAEYLDRSPLTSGYLLADDIRAGFGLEVPANRPIDRIRAILHEVKR
jgi:hypothetical protein